MTTESLQKEPLAKKERRPYVERKSGKPDTAQKLIPVALSSGEESRPDSCGSKKKSTPRYQESLQGWTIPRPSARTFSRARWSLLDVPVTYSNG